ncbi:hypothetical protein D4764_02G0002270 [Takifugu flavidus]|uniref:Uncharacterized protein n=1 Tax=Takifugu flavidus TaxID=433684 RepID=A0A5C6NJ91_9TELE|nr:hypothetical protein D4764_02G0002270 [Takifugu flavidus]
MVWEDMLELIIELFVQKSQFVFLVCISLLREGGLVVSVMEVLIKNLPRPAEAARNGNVKQEVWVRVQPSLQAVRQGHEVVPFRQLNISYSSSSCHLQKFSDDSAAVSLNTDGDDTEYRELIQDFVDWSLRNNL